MRPWRRAGCMAGTETAEKSDYLERAFKVGQGEAYVLRPRLVPLSFGLVVLLPKSHLAKQQPNLGPRLLPHPVRTFVIRNLWKSRKSVCQSQTEYSTCNADLERGAAAVCPLRDSFPGKRSLKEAELSP